MSMAPPMTRTALARRKIRGDLAAARAKFVRGPMAARVMVLGGLVERMVRISSTASLGDGVNRRLGVGGLSCVATVAAVVIGSLDGDRGGRGSKR